VVIELTRPAASIGRDDIATGKLAYSTFGHLVRPQYRE
jgi:hypothetical protein